MKTKKQKRLPWSPDSGLRFIERAILRSRSRHRLLLREFADWLERDRSLAFCSIERLVRAAGLFLAAVTRRRSCVAGVRKITPRAIEAYFVRYGRDHGMASREHMQSSMRNFLRFAAYRGWVSRGLADAVPSLHTYRLSNIPRGISETDVRRLLRSVRSSPPRDRAIVLLLACYGVRRGQISQLDPSDINWSSRTITFRATKGGKAVSHTLVAAVADPLARYLRHRPPSDSPRIFLRSRPPYLGLSPAAITTMVQKRLGLLGVNQGPHGPHALRHAFATRLLAARQPIKAIADLLGHRTLASTSVYAKVDRAGLLEVATDWPKELS